MPMRYIRDITAKNFKSLVDFKLDLAKFTCLIGLSGAGKSTVLQFIDFLAQQVRGDIKGWLEERHWEAKDLKSQLTKKKNIEFLVHSMDGVVAVLFRDADTATAGRGPWPEKRQSMLDGFTVEGFAGGVPMIPKPTSEAWLLCALRKNPYQGCAALEDRSSSPHSPHPLKGELEKRLGRPPTGEALCELAANGRIDHRRIDMPSFNAFRERLAAVL